MTNTTELPRSELPLVGAERLDGLDELRRSFLERYPRSSLATMTLEQYTNLDRTDSFTYWVETKLKRLGSIKGQTSFKFGIYRRKSSEPKVSDSAHSYSDEYAWRTSLGASTKDVFSEMRRRVVAIANHAAAGELTPIDDIDVMPFFKWKLAFLYQDRDTGHVLPIFSNAALHALYRRHVDASAGNLPMSVRYSGLRTRFSQIADPIELGFRLWADHEAHPSAEDEDADEPTEASANSPGAGAPLASSAGPGATPARALTAPRNVILHGPPGTGKTFATMRRALRLVLGDAPVAAMEEEQARAAYRKFVADGRIAVVTFHQSYGYEEFVEGIRPALNEGSVSYEMRAGVFKQIALHAAAAGLRRDMNEPTFDALWSELIHRLGDDGKNFKSSSGKEYLLRPTTKDNIESLRVERDGHNAATVTESRMLATRSIAQLWWVHRAELGPPDDLGYQAARDLVRRDRQSSGGHHFPPQWIIYRELHRLEPELRRQRVSTKRTVEEAQDALNSLVTDVSPFAFEPSTPQFVLVIDEINRGNVSKVLGELITLLEPDKRLGMPNELRLRLANSSEDQFAVPPNLHIVATMNTADRSIALMDVALRRRFEFEPVMPDAEALRFVLAAREVASPLVVLVVALLETMNRRIRFLYDHDHQIGHAYFIGVTDLESLRRVMLDRIVPLLQEYFYGRWDKVAAVLGCPYDERGTPLRRGAVSDGTKYHTPIVDAVAAKVTEVLGHSSDDHEDRLEHQIAAPLATGEAKGADLARYFLGVLQLEPGAMSTRAAALAETKAP